MGDSTNNTSTSKSDKSSTGSGGAFEAAGSAANVHAPHQHHPDVHKHHSAAYGAEGYEMANCDVSNHPAPPLSSTSGTSRKRKGSSYGTSSLYDEETGGDDSSRSSYSMSEKKQNHSEIEKRRRDKMNTYISELSSMIPMCSAMARKLDKLTVLRMAVAHLRSVRGSLSACPLATRPRPACLSERELSSLVVRAAHDCFLLVVGCDRGRLLYVSATVKQMLHYERSELLGQSLFDILHPKDVAKVKEQLSSPDLSPRERLIDAKTMLPVKPEVVLASCLCLGARRSFFCRIKCKSLPEAAPSTLVKEETEQIPKMRKKHNEKKYCVVQCTGYLKSWAPTELSEGGGGCEDGDPSSLSCLVAVGRTLSAPALAPNVETSPASAPARRIQYVSRHAPDGKFVFVDQRVTLALGFLPQELLGTSLYEYMSGPELAAVARTHKASLIRREPLHTPPYCFRKKDGSYTKITTHFKPFKNPWTKEVECLVANNTVVEKNASPASSSTPTHFSTPFACPSVYKTSGEKAGEEWPSCSVARGMDTEEEMRRLITTQVESHKIGANIVEEATRGATDHSPDIPTDLVLDPAFSQQVSLVDNMFEPDLCYGEQVRNNVTLSVAGPPISPTPPPGSPPLPPLSLDGNSEAAMAVFMSLLEADAGLGGPINFSGLPWPLP